MSRARGKVWLGLCVLAAIATAREYFARGHRSGAALWALIAVLFAIQMLSGRMPFSVRKGLTTTVLLGLVAISGWVTLVWYGDRNYANMAVTAYSALAFGGAAIWAAAVWKPAASSASPVPGPRAAIVIWLLAGYVFLYAFSLLSAGYLPLAVLAWATSAFLAAGGVVALLLHRRLRRQIEVAERLGFEDLHVYCEARKREGISLEQMAAETGLKPEELKRAANTWKEFRLRTARLWG